MSQDEFEHRDPQLLAAFLMSKTASVTASTIAQGRLSLIRLLRYLHDTGEDWDGQFGHLTELDLFGFLMTVHTQGTANATPGPTQCGAFPRTSFPPTAAPPPTSSRPGQNVPPVIERP